MTVKQCKACGKEVTGKKTYCDDACRMEFNRSQPEQSEQPQPEHLQPEHQPEQSGLAHYIDNPTMYVERSEPERLNWDTWMDMGELKSNKFKANRVSIPGDWDYE